MFTKTLKKYMALGLVLAFCSASSVASETKVLTAAQYQPLIAAGYGLAEGIAVTGTTLVGCTAPAYIALPILDSEATTGDAAPTPMNLHWHTITMDILTKAKAASRSIEVIYRAAPGGSPECVFESLIMR